MSSDFFIADISRHVWDTKYRFRDGDTILTFIVLERFIESPNAAQLRFFIL